MIIDRVVDTDVSGQGEAVSYRPVAFFRDHQKGLVLNKTNATTIAAVHGDETDNWIGKELEIFPTTTEFRGKNAFGGVVKNSVIAKVDLNGNVMEVLAQSP